MIRVWEPLMIRHGMPYDSYQGTPSGVPLPAETPARFSGWAGSSD